MKNYYRLMLGEKSKYAAECLAGNFVGTDFHIHQDLTTHLPEQWRDFNKEFIPVYLKQMPDKSKVAAGLACGAIWTVSKGMQKSQMRICFLKLLCLESILGQLTAGRIPSAKNLDIGLQHSCSIRGTSSKAFRSRFEQNVHRISEPRTGYRRLPLGLRIELACGDRSP